MIILLKRYYYGDDVTLGLLRISNTKPIYTLERPWLDNQKNVSCIPTGTYDCAPYSSDKYSDVYEVLDVHNRTYILFHSGNYVEDTKGCILPGCAVESLKDKKARVSYSRKAMDILRDSVADGRFQLVIKDL